MNGEINFKKITAQVLLDKNSSIPLPERERRKVRVTALQKSSPRPSPFQREGEQFLKNIISQIDTYVDKGLLRLEKPGGGPIKELHLELTHRCNLKCVMCHHWEMPFDDPSSVAREMNFETIRKLVENSEKLKDVEMIVLSGGEPMLRPDIVEIAALLVRHYPKASLGILANFWNTELLRRRLTALQAKGVSKLWLGSSLDGVGATHDKIRGQKGAFEGLLKSIAMMRSEFPQIPFSFSFTITPKNYNQLWPTYQFVTGEGISFGAQMVVNHQGFEAPETFKWKESQIARIESQVDKILMDICRKEDALGRLALNLADSRWLWSRILYWRYLKEYARKPKRFFKDCLAGERFAMFDPEGNLFYCPVNKHRTVGDAVQVPFDQVWNSTAAQKERDYVHSCQCDCWLNCIANPVIDRALSLAMISDQETSQSAS